MIWQIRPRINTSQQVLILWVVVKIMVSFWGALNIGAAFIIRIQKGTMILTTTHIPSTQVDGAEMLLECNS